MVVLLHPAAIDVDKLRHEGPPVQTALSVEIRNVPDDQITVVFSQGIALIEKTADVVVMTGQFD